jgi:hypothetical protein
MSSDFMSGAIGSLGVGRGIAKSRPTTREVLSGTASAEQDALERAFFSRVVLPNGTVKTTNAHRLDDLNEAVFPFVAACTERPVQIMDVGVSSGVSTLEWYESLANQGVDCHIAATDLTVYASLVSLTPGLGVLIDRDRNILHLDVLGRGTPAKAKGLRGVFAGFIRTLFRMAMMLDGSLAPLNGQTRMAATGWLLKCEPVTLLTKKLVQHSGLRVIEDDLLASNRPEFGNAFHVVRAANILNRAYFSAEVLKQTVRKLKDRLKKNGILIVCRTTDDGNNNATLFRLTANSEFHVLLRLGSGSEIEDLVTRV